MKANGNSKWIMELKYLKINANNTNLCICSKKLRPSKWSNQLVILMIKGIIISQIRKDGKIIKKNCPNFSNALSSHQKAKDWYMFSHSKINLSSIQQIN